MNTRDTPLSYFRMKVITIYLLSLFISVASETNKDPMLAVYDQMTDLELQSIEQEAEEQRKQKELLHDTKPVEERCAIMADGTRLSACRTRHHGQLVCLSKEKFCDGTTDCPDNSDEDPYRCFFTTTIRKLKHRRHSMAGRAKYERLRATSNTEIAREHGISVSQMNSDATREKSSRTKHSKTRFRKNRYGRLQ